MGANSKRAEIYLADGGRAERRPLQRPGAEDNDITINCCLLCCEPRSADMKNDPKSQVGAASNVVAEFDSSIGSELRARRIQLAGTRIARGCPEQLPNRLSASDSPAGFVASEGEEKIMLFA